jgi:predicted site-specific integrase-resolvase
MTISNTKTFAYCRVSAKDQNEDRQVEAMIELGINERDIFIDKCSGKDFERPQYQALKLQLREGDVLVIKSIDRLGRGSARWQIFRGMNLTDRLIDNIPSVLDYKEINTNVDFTLAKEIIKTERIKAVNWLKEALEKPIKEPTKEDLLCDYIISERERNNIPNYIRYSKKVVKKVAKITKWIIRKLLFRKRRIKWKNN